MPTTSRVTSKGQITIPKEVRERLGLRVGDQVAFVEEEGVYRVEKCAAPSKFARWRGYLSALEGRDPDELVDEMRGHDHGD